MSNSVVKVTDEALNDSLLLLVGEDGTVTPDKETVTTYLNSKTEPTNLQVLHINKSDSKGVDVSIDNLTYVPDSDDLQESSTKDMDEVTRHLYNIRLDHDYTPYTSAKRGNSVTEEDEIVKTLSILDGGSDSDIKTVKTNQKVKPVQKQVDKLQKQPVELSKVRPKATPIVKTKPVRQRAKIATEEELEDEDDDEEYDVQADENNENDSDYEIDEQKLRPTRKRVGKRTKSESKTPTKLKPKDKVEVKSPEPSPQAQSEVKPSTPVDKKPVKKEKKPPKPIPDDFALFSTPDIIRRVSGSKEPSTPTSESPTSPSKPARITLERSKSTSDPTSSPQKPNRLSVDGKFVKEKERRLSTDVKKRPSLDEKPKCEQMKRVKPVENLPLNQIDDLGTMITNLSEELNNTNEGQNVDQIGLDLDQTLLDNINNEDLSEDLLYQVAQSLVGNSDLQNAIDKGLQEGVLDPNVDSTIQSTIQEQNNATVSSTGQDSGAVKVGTQIVRPDGRVVLIPPIERPTTRSRNKKKDDEVAPVVKPAHKPLDEEHVSGNELDSSNEEEEESEDDPNKLWCICNQPHNNRFMICCDTCEEWYHGKCVNITKLMGQQMEAEGKEWICRFCKDPSLKRPQAAARRIRKASRNSRTSTESNGTTKSGTTKADGVGTGAMVPCVVCQKPARKNSIFCSEACILQHAQGVERVVVFERSTGRMLTGSKAPSASNLDEWLKKHPGYEVVRSGGKIVTAKQNLSQSKLKIVKNTDNDGVSLAVQKKSGVNVGVLKHTPSQVQAKITSFKILNKQSSPKVKLIPGSQSALNQMKPVTILNPGHVNKPKTPTTPTVPVIKKLPVVSKDKPVPLKTPKSRQQEQAALNPSKQQENIRENVQKTLFEHLTNRLKMTDDLKLTNDEIKSISTDIEAELYKCFGDTGQKYRNKYRSLIFNIKDVKNQTLWRRICEKTINPYELVRLSPDDLASQELALWREREAKHQLDMIKKSELELLNCNRQYVLKTHKGEQVLEDSRPTDNLDNTEVIKSLTENTALEAGAVDAKQSKEEKKSGSKHSHKDRKSSKEKSESKDRRSRERTRRRSHSRDRKHSSSDKKRSRSRDRHRRSSHHKSSRHKKEQSTPNHHISTTDKLDKKSKEILEQLVDNKIVPPLEDRLWKHVVQEDVVGAQAESDSDHEPTSTVTIPTPPRSVDAEDVPNQAINETGKASKVEEERTVTPPPTQTKPEPSEMWRGTINMIDVARITVIAYDVAGDNSSLNKELVQNLDIVGRISPDTVWEYISKMKCSNSKEISVLRLAPTNVEEKMPYLALYTYLNTKNRLGVVKSTNKAVKDFYIYPLGPQKAVPSILMPFNGPGLDESRAAMLLGIIVRNKKKRFVDVTAQTSATKRVKVDVVAAPARSYTPPPIKDPRLSKLPLPPAVSAKNDDEEPYSPEDSDPDGSPPVLDTSSVFLNAGGASYQPTEPYIPGLGGSPPSLFSNTLEIQRQMEELNKEIEQQKSEINSISQNIATASTEIGSTALANIALPSNLQQILDSIKTIGTVGSETDVKGLELGGSETNQTDLTIPLMIPKSFSRPLSDTIPLNLPTKSKLKQQSSSSPKQGETNSVLSSLSEEELIRKAAEMLGETEDNSTRKRTDRPSTPPPPSIKRSKLMDVDMRQQMPMPPNMDVELPPVPGLD